MIQLPAARRGTVHLVGAGPGDPGLLTLRAARLLGTASYVAHDRLVDPATLSLVAPDAVLRPVGKRAGAGWSQRDIEDVLVAAAREGHAVVRLKGGDPFVFGRGGEEAAACVAAGIPFEVVPGITSAVAAAGAAGIPVTHRGLAPAFAVVTGHEDPAKGAPQLDWDALAAFPGTLVVLMGVGTLGATADRLLAAGRDPATPAAIVRWATTDRQQVVEAPLGRLADEVARAGLRPPATVVIGDVVAMRGVLAATPALVATAA